MEISKKMKKVINIISIIIWMAVIFTFSAMSGEESNQKSKEAIKETVNTIKNLDSKESGESEEKTTTEPNKEVAENPKNNEEAPKERLVEKLNTPLRKGMHASEYCILSILILNCMQKYNIKKSKSIIIAIIISFIYACTDEFHQLFVIGRTSRFTDVLIDTAGAIIGCVFYIIILKIILNLKNNQKFINGKIK